MRLKVQNAAEAVPATPLDIAPPVSTAPQGRATAWRDAVLERGSALRGVAAQDDRLRNSLRDILIQR